MSIQWDPVRRGGELIQYALHQEAVIPEIGQPMLHNHLGRLHLRHRHLKSKVAGVLNLPPCGRVASLRS